MQLATFWKMDIIFDEAWPLSDIWKKYSTYTRSFPEDQFERSRGLQCDVLTWLMSVRSDKQYSQKCSKGLGVSLPDIYPSHLIEKHIRRAFTLRSASIRRLTICGLWPNTKQPFKPFSVSCSHMKWMIYQTNLDVMVTVIKHNFRGECTVLYGENSNVHHCIQWAVYLDGSL